MTDGQMDGQTDEPIGKVTTEVNAPPKNKSLILKLVIQSKVFHFPTSSI